MARGMARSGAPGAGRFLEGYEPDAQGLENALIVPGEVTDSTGKVVRRDRLGGLLGFYYREAA